MQYVETTLRLTLQYEWPQPLDPSVIQYSYKIDAESEKIHFILDSSKLMDDKEKDPFWEIETILQSHLPDDWRIDTAFNLRPNGHNLRPGEVMWYRQGDHH